ncbi:MAG: hypothetical protein FWF86_03955, partial [Clostridia bacterium]|nr:hypothetical protein [Clostridia bacterium]
VELWQYSTPKQDEQECTFVLNNVSDKVAISIQVTLVCHDREDKLLFQQNERVQGLAAAAGERFSITLLPSQWQDVANVELVVEKVWFDDATIWRRGSQPLYEYRPNALAAGRRLDQLRFIAGQDAVGYPQEQDHVWLCVCGRPNARNSRRCCRCGRWAKAVFTNYRQQQVDQYIAVHEQKLSVIAQKAREDAGKLTEAREKATRQQKLRRRRLLWAAAGIVVLAAIAVTTLLWMIPAQRYRYAEGLLADGRYSEAREAFAAMVGYGDAAGLRLRSDYLEAQAWLDAGDTASLQRAADAFLALDDYEDSHSQNRQAIYRMGEAALAEGAYDSAATHFQELGEYGDSAEKLQEVTYRQAARLMEEDGYTAAQVLFEGLGKYRDAAEKALACQYSRGRDAEESGDYAQAILHYEALDEYEDAPRRLRESCYTLAETHLAEGKLEEAGLLYQRAGDTRDAALKANDILYQAASQRLRTRDYAKAAELFSLIVPYLDSESLGWECVYRQGEFALLTGDPAAAAALFASIPLYRDSYSRTQECEYRLAQQEAKDGNLAEAVSLLEKLQGFQDGARLLNQTRYQWAGMLMAEEDYARAASLFEVLGSYADSDEKLKQCRYSQAQSALAAGEYAAAAEGFSGLGKYKDAQELLQAATFELAMRQKEDGDYQNAAVLLATLPQNSEARAQLTEVTFAEALRRKEQGDLAGAGELYLALGNEGDARESYLDCRYQLGQQLKRDGNLAQSARVFSALGAYRDAAAQTEECYRQYVGTVAESARDAFAAKDYPAVLLVLDGLELQDIPVPYNDLKNIYNQACYAYAEQLYREGKPYEALPYYERIPAYRDVADKKLERRAYLILGEWISASGKTALFRTDGTCALDGQELAFSVDNYSVWTGSGREAMTLTHKLTNISKEAMTLREISSNGVNKYTRVNPGPDAPDSSGAATAGTPQQPLPPAEDGANSMLVQEDEP